MNELLLIKLTATPLLILFCMFGARRWGAFAAGLLAGFPTISGPISLLLTLERGAAFSAQAAYHTLWGIEACGASVLAYAWLAYAGVPWYAVLTISLATFFLAGWGALFCSPALGVLILITALMPCLILLFLPKFAPDEGKSARMPGWMIPLQMAGGIFLVYGISEAAPRLGAGWSGLLAFFPVLICAIVPAVHVSCGVASAVGTIRGFMTGWFGGIAFTVCVALGVEHLSVPMCYTLASVSALAASGVAVSLRSTFTKKRK